jgi:hypothetical protein
MNAPRTPRDYLVSGSEHGAATNLFLVEACKVHPVDPHARLTAWIDLWQAFGIPELNRQPTPLRPPTVSACIACAQLSSCALNAPR